MNIVCIQSGLGNQLFQYAFYRSLCQRQPDTYMDISQYAYRPSHNGYELERLFDISAGYATTAMREELVDISKDFFSTLRRGLGIVRHTTGHLREEPQGELVRFDPSVWEEDNCYFKGYWQSEKYFCDIEDMLRKELRFRQPLTRKEDLLLWEQTGRTESVSVHIRRGDYLKKRRRDDYDVCTPLYYQRAVEYILNTLDNPVFYIFSDEIEWVRQNMPFPSSAVFVEGHSGNDAWQDMFLMSHCKHHIIANSSFSWWGAWLNPEKDKMVLAPDRWFRHRRRPDILPACWKTIETE